MSSFVRNILMGVIAVVLICAVGFYIYAKIYTVKPIHADRSDVEFVSVVDLRSGYSATITEKDQVDDALNILAGMKAYRSFKPADDLKTSKTGAMINIKKSDEEGFGSIYTFIGDNLILSEDEKVYEVKPSVYDKISEVCKKYGENNELLDMLKEGNLSDQ